MKRKFDRFGFEILDDEEPLDFTSTDEDDEDLNCEDQKPWWSEDHEDNFKEEEYEN